MSPSYFPSILSLVVQRGKNYFFPAEPVTLFCCGVGEEFSATLNFFDPECRKRGQVSAPGFRYYSSLYYLLRTPLKGGKGGGKRLRSSSIFQERGKRSARGVWLLPLLNFFNYLGTRMGKGEKGSCLSGERVTASGQLYPARHEGGRKRKRMRNPLLNVCSAEEENAQLPHPRRIGRKKKKGPPLISPPPPLRKVACEKSGSRRTSWATRKKKKKGGKVHHAEFMSCLVEEGERGKKPPKPGLSRATLLSAKKKVQGTGPASVKMGRKGKKRGGQAHCPCAEHEFSRRPTRCRKKKKKKKKRRPGPCAHGGEKKGEIGSRALAHVTPDKDPGYHDSRPAGGGGGTACRIFPCHVRYQEEKEARTKRERRIGATKLHLYF